MKKRNVMPSNVNGNFLGYQVENGFLKCGSKFGCQSDWPDLLRYSRKLNVTITFEEGDAVVKDKNGSSLDQGANLCKSLYNLSVKRDITKANSLVIQGPFLRLTNINKKISHTILYNWRVSDDLVRFALKARLSILPTNFTTYIWNRERNPFCPFGCLHSESIAHLFNGCLATFGNFYSRRHNRIVGKVCEFLKNLLVDDSNVYCEKQIFRLTASPT